MGAGDNKTTVYYIYTNHSQTNQAMKVLNRYRILIKQNNVKLTTLRIEGASKITHQI